MTVGDHERGMKFMKWQNNNMAWNILLRSACHSAVELLKIAHSSYLFQKYWIDDSNRSTSSKIHFFVLFVKTKKKKLFSDICVTKRIKSQNFPYVHHEN